jgi:hypothetical protein
MRLPFKVAMALYALALLLVLCAAIGGLHSESKGLPHRPKNQSFDQENLKRQERDDCPAYYDAPNGNLRFCG